MVQRVLPVGYSHTDYQVSRNKFCFTGGLIEGMSLNTFTMNTHIWISTAAVTLPGTNNIAYASNSAFHDTCVLMNSQYSGLWPAV